MSCILFDGLSEKVISLLNQFNYELDNFSNSYSSEREIHRFQNEWLPLYLDLKHKHIFRHKPGRIELCNFKSRYSRIESIIKNYNKNFLIRENENPILSNIDGKSLDNQQRTVVLTDEDRTLV